MERGATAPLGGQLILARNQDSRLEYGYDPRGLLRFERRIALGRDETLLHDLDALGNRIATRLPDGRTVNWLHYGSGHLHQINLDGEVVCDLERDALHREIGRTQGALASRYRLDPEGRLLLQQTEQHGPDKTAPVQGGLVIERRYAYDRAGQLQSIGDRRRGQLRYRYDALGRLTEALHGDGQAERFAFDPAHNLIEPNGAALPDNRLTVFEDKRYRYDERGNLLEKKIGAREVQRFRWDPVSRPLSAHPRSSTNRRYFRHSPSFNTHRASHFSVRQRHFTRSSVVLTRLPHPTRAPSPIRIRTAAFLLSHPLIVPYLRKKYPTNKPSSADTSLGGSLAGPSGTHSDRVDHTSAGVRPPRF